MFAEFWELCGTEILMGIATTVGTAIAIVAKNLYQKYINDQTKKDVVKTVVQGVEQMYKDLHGEDKLNAALTNASEMLALKGINVSDFELRMLIEAAVGEFNRVFTGTTETAE